MAVDDHAMRNCVTNYRNKRILLGLLLKRQLTKYSETSTDDSRFPLTNDFLNRKSIVATRRENFQPTANHLLCSLHFEENCYMENYLNRRQQKDDAISTVFGFPTHLKKVTKARKPPKPKPRNVETAENVCVDVHVSAYTGDHNYSFPLSPSKLKEKFVKTEERKGASRNCAI
ncbi:THAP domain-containing protein 2-like [Schistocerca nitens]|uniref:THAP domain-containing protein 2-like n=1 Tax=Schistocerca nitens TaxID=7011 RepID=UPI002118F688|nr:THAP domain-containing protein 2-like [Schistocerca nitens]